MNTPVEPDCPETEPEVIHVPVTPATAEGGFHPDFSIVSGIHRTGNEVLESLYAKNMLPSKWTIESLLNEDLVLPDERTVRHIVALSMLDMGFLENELAPLEVVLDRAQEIGLDSLSFGDAMAVREQFIAQPDYSTGHRLGEFFIGMHPTRLAEDGGAQNSQRYSG